MKRIISIALVLFLSLTLYACDTGVFLNAEDVEKALEECEGKLEMTGTGEKVKSFTYTVDDVNTEDLVDRDYVLEAMYTLMTDPYEMSMAMYKVCKPVQALMNIMPLLVGGDSAFNGEVLAGLLDITCDGKTGEYNGWLVSGEVSKSADCFTITVKPA